MQDFPHHYLVEARAKDKGNVSVSSPGLETFESASPAEFGGPGNLWSPETLLVAAVADCFILSFRAIARIARVEWISLRCRVAGDLDKSDNLVQFVGFKLNVVLELPPGAREETAAKLLKNAEQHCLITNSLKVTPTMNFEVRVIEAAT